MATSRRTKIDLAILAFVLIAGGIAAKNAPALGDYAHMLTYTPTAEVQQLAADAGMSSTGKRMFYRFSPELADKQRIRQLCGPRLGCVEGRNIYILKGTTEAEYNTAVVTAAHEMLHVAYSRLDSSTRNDIDSQSRAALKGSSNRTIAGKIFLYMSRPERYINEAHSYLGTETDAISPRLESHYARYFSERSKVVAAHRASTER